MPEHETPEVMRLSLDRVVLTTKLQLAKFGNVSDLLAASIDPPSTQRVVMAWEDLYRIGAISSPNEFGTPTLLGEMGVRLPTDLRGSRLIMFGLLHGCACDAIVLAAALSTQDPFSLPFSPLMKGGTEYAKSLRLSLVGRVKADGGCFSEPLALLALFREWMDTCGHGNTHLTMQWAWKKQLNFPRFRRFRSVVADLARKVVDNWGDIVTNADDLRRLAGLKEHHAADASVFHASERLILYVLCSSLSNFLIAAAPKARELESSLGEDASCRSRSRLPPVVLTTPKFVTDAAVLQEAMEAAQVRIESIKKTAQGFLTRLATWPCDSSATGESAAGEPEGEESGLVRKGQATQHKTGGTGKQAKQQTKVKPSQPKTSDTGKQAKQQTKVKPSQHKTSDTGKQAKQQTKVKQPSKVKQPQRKTGDTEKQQTLSGVVSAAIHLTTNRSLSSASRDKPLPSHFELLFLHYLKSGRPMLTVPNPYFAEPIPGTRVW